MSNQAWQITAPGTLTLNNIDTVPDPGAKEVVVRIHAVALNYRDKLVIDHNPAYPVKHKANLVPTCDGAGIVEDSGQSSRWKKGDRVVVNPNTWIHGADGRDFELDKALGGGENDGTLRKWMTVSDESLLRAPENLSMEEASTIFTAGVTAYRSLFYGGVKLQPGVTVLTQGTGGVSCYAIMVAAAAGATVVATSSSDEKLQVARKLGATHLVNYRTTTDWAAKVLEVTGGHGADLVVDVVGAQSIEQTLKCTAFAGVVCVVGMLSEDPAMPVNVMAELLFGGKTLRGQLGAGSRQMAEELSAFMARHDLHPPVAEVFDFEKAPEALEALTKLSAPGKIVLRC
ncbi:hypothetical protein LTR37_010359 [Vermiconidia calcicola]|uniref:Uncharacterized protein n=1 Tax=Vermiconidia calcicola TaxID=1690605 RepID=A0ACC3N537_9PEZI|nr:hypothetical protein LTR37_010359 [Vermiconidia calcicola]